MCRTGLVVRVRRIHSGQREYTPVPCGKCVQCVSAKILQWQFRLDCELRVSHSPKFVTLTYNNRFLPKKEIERIDYKTGEILPSKFVPTLVPSHVQDYIKKLRFHYREKYPDRHHEKGCKCGNCPSIRYYLVGEYGTKHKRPHYHIILLNCHDEKLIERTWSFFDRNANRFRAFGFVDISPLRSVDAIRYTLKYCYKQSQPAGVLGSRPFSRMSKGIGRNYINVHTLEYHNRGVEFSSVLYNGKRIPMPKYLKERIYDDEKRFLVTRFLQKESEVRDQRRAEKTARLEGLTVDEVLTSIYKEQFSPKFLARRYEIH